MNERSFFKTRLYFTSIVTIAIWALLAWSHYHEGVPSHHILNRKDMPAISNWWGGILLPLLTWFLLYRVEKRLIGNGLVKLEVSKFPTNTIYGFAGALFFGIVLSAFFTFDYVDIPGYMLMGLFLLALFVPIYRAECLLGFVIGMTFTFGAVLPAIVGGILALIGAVIYLYVRPVIVYVAARVLRYRKADNG
jgi:MFS family permease